MEVGGRQLALELDLAGGTAVGRGTLGLVVIVVVSVVRWRGLWSAAVVVVLGVLGVLVRMGVGVLFV